MVFAFDSLGYSKRLKAAGVADREADAHAEAARDFVMAELATRSDLDVLRRELEGKIDTMTLRLTVRLGLMLGAAVAILATIIQLGA